MSEDVTSWATLVGRWNLGDEGSATYLGRQADEREYGTVLSNIRISGGTIRAFAEPTEAGAVITTYASARLHLDKLPQDRFWSTLAGKELRFFRFKWRGKKLLQIELNEDE
jgi:hypothetical protein